MDGITVLLSHTTVTERISKNYDDGQVYWAYQVPEPSTAIAMGLLGIVGFAGNRRRRRQVSVA